VVHAEHAQVADGEGAVGHIRESELAQPGACNDVARLASDLGERVLIGVTEDRGHEPCGRVHGETDVYAVVHEDLAASFAGVGSVDLGMVCKGECDSADDEVVHRDLLSGGTKSSVELSAQRHEGFHVRNSGGSESRKRCALGDALSDSAADRVERDGLRSASVHGCFGHGASPELKWLVRVRSPFWSVGAGARAAGVPDIAAGFAEYPTGVYGSHHTHTR
jgi:hypothetical protein